MELMVLLEFLKLLWIGFEIGNYFVSRKREKALIETFEEINQRLIQLEKVKKDS